MDKDVIYPTMVIRSQAETIEIQEKEIERLKAREEEITQKYLSATKYASEKEDENIRLNNIIDELEKEFEWQLKKQIDIDKFAEEQGFLNYNPVKLMVEHFKNKLSKLKEGMSDE